MIRLALLPPHEPDRWWLALADSLASRGDVDALWVSDRPAGDDRLGWLPVSAPAGTDAAAPTGAAAAGPAPQRAALVVDVRAPRADVVAAMAAELPVLMVTDGPLDATAEALARRAHRLLVPAAVVARALPPDLPVAVVPAMLDGLDLTEGADRRLDGAPTVAVLGAPLSDHVRLAWAPMQQRWADAVLVGDLDALEPAARATVLADAHVVIVLDAGGAALAEALASGATVIAHAEPAAAAVLTHGTNGLLTDARSPELLAGSLAYALGYHERLVEVRRAGRALAWERFSTATLAARVLAELDLAAQAAGRGAGSGSAVAPVVAVPDEPALTPTRSVI
ncbi:MAG: glycosyltransferase [Acidimicrobiia bacterium]